MDELDVVRDVAGRLERAGIPYMLTGSMAMNFYAQPRMTRAIDVVIDAGAEDAERLAALFAPDYYVSPEAVRDAVRRRFLFNVIHQESLIKVDCIVRKAQPFRQVEFERRQRVRVGDADVAIVSKEDLILSKLDWARDSHSEVQLRDVRNLLATGCDEPYLRHWLEALGLTALATPLIP